MFNDESEPLSQYYKFLTFSLQKSILLRFINNDSFTFEQ